MKQLLESIREFRGSFVVAVGDKSPFAKTALLRLDGAVEKAASRQTDSSDPNKPCKFCGGVFGGSNE